MFGYIRPLKGELRVREYDKFKAVYCGLCHCLKRRCGFSARFVVNFDFTFMAMLLSEAEKPCWEHHRCVASPFKKKACYCGDSALDTAADYSVILAYWKLKDSVADEGFLKSLTSRVAALLLRRAYKKAAANAHEFDKLVKENLQELSILENEKCASMDLAADKFAEILKTAAQGAGSDEHRRILSQVFYHTGRIVYLLDAVDDLRDNHEKGGYNPLIHRFALEDGVLTADAEATVRLTMRHSQNLLSSAFELMPESHWTEIISNIVYSGIPWVSEKVFSGEWRNIQKTEKPDNY